MTGCTGYARLTPRSAKIVLGAVILVAVAAAAVTLSPLGSTNIRPGVKGGADVALYRAEVDRIHRGEGYYEAAAAELAPRGFPTRSVFNWRTPLPMWLLGKLPAAVMGKLLLGGLALLLLAMALEATARDLGDVARGWMRPLACLLLLTGALLPTVLGDLFVVPVLWAGVLLALSVCAYGVNRPYTGVAFGLAAVFVRELALPYCLLALGIAWWQGRRREMALWLLGLLAWTTFFALHCWRVSGLIGPDAIAHQHGWIRFGGAGFVISLAQMNAYLLLLPQWVAALYLVAALVGFGGWTTPLGTRIGLGVCLFLAAFAAVGQSFNQYWGSLIAPLLCFGVARLPASLRDLWTAATRPAVSS
ncbi:MAG: hypothetical protein ABFC96_15965 [Thermoguttaceae bacterium]